MFLGGTKALGADLRKNSRMLDQKLRSLSCSTVSLPHYLHLPRQVTLTSARLPLHQSKGSHGRATGGPKYSKSHYP